MFGDNENDFCFAHAVYTLTKDSSLKKWSSKIGIFWRDEFNKLQN